MTMISESNRLNNSALSFMGSKPSTALAMLRRASALDAQSDEHNPSILCNLAIALTSKGEYAEASKILHPLVTDNPHSIAAWHAYGVLSLVTGHPEDAVCCFDRCVKLDPGNGDMKFDYSLACMQAGLWREGLEAYDVRREWKPEKVFAGLPFWNGERDSTVYVWAEQGIGDTIQFARYLPWLKSISKRVVLALPHSLIGLMQGFADVCEIVTLTTDVSGIDYGTGMMSLARHYELEHGTVFARNCTERFSAEHDFGTKNGNLNVGLCWACNPSSGHYKERSVPFADMLQLVSNADCDFQSLQAGDAVIDLYQSGAHGLVYDLSRSIDNDWCKTRDWINSMDVVVSTDTSVAHLAATLGKPTIMFLARRDWWRWGNSGTTTPWYPSMTIIRAEKPFSWSKEIQIAAELLTQQVEIRKVIAASEKNVAA